VLVTHDVERGLREADVVVGLRAGAVAVAGQAGSVTAEHVRRLYE
jgi:ABC-type cobalamin/Fe3+-siderophores transport system ATPase subunit